MKARGAANIGVGVDIERIDRFRAVKRDTPWATKAFTRRELAYCMSKADPAIHLAGTFAAKEAAMKAVSQRVGSKLLLKDFEVLRAGDGAPHVNYAGHDESMIDLRIEISISHTKENAVAVAVSMV